MKCKNWIAHIEFIILLTTAIVGFYCLCEKIDSSVSIQSKTADTVDEMFMYLISDRDDVQLFEV